MMKRTADTPNGNHGMDADLDIIEEENTFGIPGASRIPSKQLLASIRRLADMGNQDENATEITAPTGTGRIDLKTEPPAVRNEGLASVGPGSLSTIINSATEGSKMSLQQRIAYIMENGQPFCNHCKDYYLPKTLGITACTYCGCGRPNDQHNSNGNFSHVEGETVADEVGGKEIIKVQSISLASTDDYVKLFNSKIATDSDNYHRGYNDAMNGQELDEDLALLSDDYYNGYEQYKFFNKTPQQSVGQKLYDIKPNSNGIPRSYDHHLTPGEFDRGPIQLTDGQGRAAVANKLPFPIDVIEKFFEV